MVDVSIGVASACIAAVITILQFLLPNALALVLTGHVSESQSAVTWSVVSRFLLTSDWPVFLGSDHTASTGVSRKISLITCIKPLGLMLIAVSAIVTPLGLYDQIASSTTPRIVEFVYVSDQSVFGAGTPPRSSRGYNFSRVCLSLWGRPMQLCPGDPSDGNITLMAKIIGTMNETALETYFVRPESISPQLIDLYQSGLSAFAPSVSSFFDIQSRQWTIASEISVKNNGTLLNRASKWLSSIMMNQKWDIFEGVVVDTRSGGIGFRNHSVPSAFFQYGSEWEEDILWMQPEAACVNSNLSSIFTGSLANRSIRSTDLVDHGGFADIAKLQPYSVKADPLHDGQHHPMLQERAYWFAWYLNKHAMEYLNITEPNTNRSRISSSIGQRFEVNSTLTEFDTSPTLEFLNLRRGRIFMNLIVNAPSSHMWNSSTGTFKYQINPRVQNPYNITSDNITNAGTWFEGYGGLDKINISTIAVQMGWVVGPASMLNQTDPDNTTSVATYQRPLYICSSATKASIKTVRFRYNSTTVNGLRNLEIIDIKDKVYEQESRKPLWGFEMPWLNSTTTWNISTMNPLWGIVDESASTNRNLSVLRSDHFYIPASRAASRQEGYEYDRDSYSDFVAGTKGPPDNWAAVFNDAATDYQGDDIQRTFFKEMTQNSTGVEKLVQLMWTDYATNYMVGTRGLHTPRYKPMLHASPGRRRDLDAASASLPGPDTSSLADGHYPVYALERQIRFRVVYGIPAAICCAIVGLSMLWALVGIMCGNASIHRLRHLMYNISAGRVFASFVYPELEAEKSASTKHWIEAVGRRPVQAYGQSTSVESRGVSDSKSPHVYVRVAQKDDSETSSKI